MLGDIKSRPLISIKYCVPWDYVPQAVSLSKQLMNLCSWDISGISLIPADGGAFEVSVGDKLMYSKLETGEFPEESILVNQIRSELFTGKG